MELIDLPKEETRTNYITTPPSQTQQQEKKKKLQQQTKTPQKSCVFV